jgi:hypothetical protein
LADWNQTTLSKEMQNNPGKLKREVLEVLFDKLERMAKILNFKNVISSQVLLACRGFPETDFALFNPGDNYDKICTQLRSAINILNSKRSYLQDLSSQHLQDNYQDNQNPLAYEIAYEDDQEDYFEDPRTEHYQYLFDRRYNGTRYANSRPQTNSRYPPRHFGNGRRGLSDSQRGFRGRSRSGNSYPGKQDSRPKDKVCYVCGKQDC